MLRLRMDVADLARTTFAPATPYCELAVSAQAFQQPTSPFQWMWRSGRRPMPARARRLLELVPAQGSVPTFLAPENRSSLDEAIDVVRSTPTAQLEASIAEMAWSSGPTPWIRDLARGRVDALEELGQVMRAYHDHVMAPLWPTVRQVTAADLRERAWQLATEGAAATLNALHPGIRWRDGVLEIDGPFGADVALGGQGLRVMPSVWTRPGVALDWTQPTLVYPVPTSSWIRHLAEDDRHDNLATLLGATRARILRALAREHTTSELANSLGISLASASTHAAVLRGAGLVATRRDGRAVRHAQTDLGHRMVRGR